ncbi:MAG TPA: IS1634 family transposase, partial [Phycisphaerae bacterium]|nr:IS1634 family transposase [Phycisphaerae bacterium]
MLARLCEPSSELHVAESFSRHSAVPDVLWVPVRRVNDDRLYRALDALLPHKAELEIHLKQRLGALFGLQYDLLLYDVTSTYFEGEAAANGLAKRGYSRDKRPDCKQICIALVVTRDGVPLGYEIFPGNCADVTTVEQIVSTMEARYGRADRIWVMDRGMISEETIAFMKSEGRRYIVGTPRAALRRYERELASGGWDTVHEGLEVKLCPASDVGEVFI